MPPQSGASAPIDDKSSTIPTITGNENIPDISLVPEKPDTSLLPAEEKDDAPEIIVEARGPEIPVSGNTEELVNKTEKILNEVIKKDTIQTPNTSAQKNIPVFAYPPKEKPSPLNFSPDIPPKPEVKEAVRPAENQTWHREPRQFFSQTQKEIPPQAKPAEAESSLRAIRTFQADVAQSVKQNKTSFAHMVIAEDEKRKALAEIESPTSRKNMIFLVVGAGLLLVGTISAIIIFNKTRISTVTPQAISQPALVLTEKDAHISATGLNTEQFAKAIGDEVKNVNNKLDGIENISFSEKSDGLDTPLSTQRFFFFLDSRAPPTLLRSLDPKFMFGVHTYNGNHPFIVLKTNYYENAFAGMLSWEQYLARDLFTIFNINKTSNDPAYSKEFSDKTVKNRDARVLLDEEGNIILFYVFKDRDTIIITTSGDTLNEVVRRLNSLGTAGR